jgi:MFS family permease
VFLLLGGVVVDRGDRRLIGAASGLALAALLAALAAAHASGERALWVWLAVAVGLGLLDDVRLPIGQALIPLVVAEEEVLEANRWSQLRSWGLLTIGPPLGGVGTAVFGVTGAFAVTAALYAIGGATLLALPSLRSALNSLLHSHVGVAVVSPAPRPSARWGGASKSVGEGVKPTRARAADSGIIAGA